MRDYPSRISHAFHLLPAQWKRQQPCKSIKFKVTIFFHTSGGQNSLQVNSVQPDTTKWNVSSIHESVFHMAVWETGWQHLKGQAHSKRKTWNVIEHTNDTTLLLVTFNSSQLILHHQRSQLVIVQHFLRCQWWHLTRLTWLCTFDYIAKASQG